MNPIPGADEYTVLYVFMAGVLGHGLLAAGSWRRAAGVAALAAASLLLAWYLAISQATGEDPRFDVGFGACLLFVFGLALVLRYKLLPHLSPRWLLHATLLLYYALFLSARAARVALPGSVVVGLVTPGLLTVAAAFTMHRFGRRMHTVLYVWSLVLLTVLLAVQWKLDKLLELYAHTGFSPSLMLYAFFAGGAFLYFFSNLVQILLLLPAPRRRSVLFDTIFGSTDEVRDEQAAAMVARFDTIGLTAVSITLLVLHATVLAGNAAFGWFPHGLAINVSIWALARI